MLRTDLDTNVARPEEVRVCVSRAGIWSASAKRSGDLEHYAHLATRRSLNLKGSRCEPQSQRDCALQPRVARNELPWVKVH